MFPQGIMISDPPYNQNYHYANYKDNLSDFKYRALLGVFRKPCVVIGYPEMIINVLTPMLGGVDEIVCWVYPSNTAKQSRLIAWYGCKPDFNKVRQPYKNPTDKRIMKRIADGKMARGYDWWEINQVKNVSKKHSHPCEMPLKVMENIIGILPDDYLIVDPFMGTGTTGVACKNLNRNFIGIELDPEYFKIAEKRINENL